MKIQPIYLLDGFNPLITVAGHGSWLLIGSKASNPLNCSIEAQLPLSIEAQLPFPVNLVLVSPIEAASEMVCPVNCHYNCFIRDGRWTCYDAISRVKPRFPLSNERHYGVTLARLYKTRPNTHLQSSLIQEQQLPVQSSVTAFSKDQEDIVEYFGSDSLREKPFLDDLIVTNRYYFRSEDSDSLNDEETNFTKRNQPLEEPWFMRPCDTSQYAEKDFNAHIDSFDREGTLKNFPNDHVISQSSSNNYRYVGEYFIESEKMYHQVDGDFSSTWSFSERDHPVEDPWLLYPMLDFSETSVTSVAEIPIIEEPTQDKARLQELQEQHHSISEKLLSGTESNLLPPVGLVSTEILINCSICTMQRIAVLEDGNLVELLLEPVKSNVQCDSVYLGVITKLVPHMGGAFVNIGCSRPSLMDIKHYKEPFIFPLFDTSKENDVTCPPSSVLEKNLDISHFKQAFLEEDDELADDDVEVDFEDEEFEEYVNEDTIDFDEVQTGNLIQVNSNGTDSNLGNFEYQLDGNGNHLKIQTDSHHSVVKKHRSTYDIHSAEEMWANVRKGTKILVQVVKEGLGKKGPTLTAYPKLRSRFWVLITRCKSIGVSKKISGVERTRLRVIAKSLQPPGFGVTIRTVAAGHSVEELRKDLEGLLATWRNIVEHAKSAALAADEGVEGAIPVILHQAMGQTLSVVQDYFNEKVKRMVVDSPRTYHEVTNYLQDIAPELCGRVELHRKNVPLFDEFNIEEEINNILNKRVALPNGGSLVIEQTEALVSIDVNGGHGMFGQGASQEKAIVDVNLAAAKQIARELRLRDIGGIIVVDFIDMMDDSNKRLVYEEVKKAVERDRSIVKVSELSKHGLMEITRKRVRPSVTFMVSEPCTCCHGTGRIEALETSFSKIEHEICRLLATVGQKADPESPKSWPRLLLRVDSYMSDYLTSGKRTRLATLSSSLKVWILLKVARNFARGAFEVRLLADEKGITNQQQVGGATQSAEAATIIPTKRTKLFPVKRWKAGRKL
ncbi:ribonuclease E/G-like protein, chloroplastic isoform X2 [Chenopodium quinoa]|uniref:ribonuclease E/G-like protein, chloroplastic isoform X2 n=1 Tax=Chenopodium quinoa TaxID=63459 RepID=UPI000B77C1DA|nr:ribonuclease E/G-like protein, chloroplastic isoform X2 [Chenopodium quinoa]